jgi:hypothetical protein
MCDIAERKVHNEASSQRSSFKIERISLPLAVRLFDKTRFGML